MEYNKLIAVTGLPGLFELIASKNDGAIVRSLDDKTTKFVSSRIHNFSHLETIEVYTNQENVNLATVFQAMKANKTALPAIKDGTAIKKYFEKVFPEMDFERVFSSDMKKMVRWFEILDQNGIEIKLPEMAEEAGEPSDTPSAEEEPGGKKKATQKTAEAEKAAKTVAKATDAEKVPAESKAAERGNAAEAGKVTKDEKAGGTAKTTGAGKTTTTAKAADPKKEDADPKKAATASKKADSVGQQGEGAAKKASAPRESKASAPKAKDTTEAPKKKASGKKKTED